MYIQQIKKLINKILNKNSNLKRNKKKNSRKLLITKKEKSKFKKRKKQLSLNINNIKIFNISKHSKALFFFIIGVMFIGSILFTYFGPYFKVKNINIIKEDEITNIDIAYKGVENFRGKSIFNIKNKNIFEKLTSYQQNIRQIEVKKKLPNTLKITIGSYKGVFNTTKNPKEKNYLILENGTLIPSKYNKDLKSLVVINNNSKKISSFLDYKKVYEEKYIKKINYLIKEIEENIINIKIMDLQYFVVEREIHIKIKNNLLIYSLDEDLYAQIEKTVIFNKEHHELKNEGIYYTDLRIPSKIFYCPIEDENKCRKNLKSIYE